MCVHVRACTPVLTSPCLACKPAHLCVTEQLPPGPHSNCVSVADFACLRVSVGLDACVSPREVGSWVQVPPSSLATFPLCTVCTWVSPHPSPKLRPHLGTRLIGKLTACFFPQVPPGAAETPKAPGTSELHGGHLQGTRMRGSESGGRGRLGRGQGALALEQGALARAWHTQASGKVCGWMNT